MSITEQTPAGASQPGPRVSLEEYLAFCGEGPLTEWVGGEVVVHMPPTTRHQQVQLFLSILLAQFVEATGAGVVVPAPYAMVLGPDGPAREPDIVAVTKEHLERVGPGRLDGPADLVVEIVSDDSVARDRAEKFYEYQEAGVREYWVIDPRPGVEREDFWVLDEDGRYRPVPVGTDRIYRSTVLPGFWLRMDWLRADPLPPTRPILAGILEGRSS